MRNSRNNEAPAAEALKPTAKSVHAATDPYHLGGLSDVWSVADFARRYRLEAGEKNRLLKLFGRFAASADLLRHVQR